MNVRKENMLNYFEVAEKLPPEYPETLLESNHREFFDQNISIIVLDDDPTGTQTMYDVPVLTTWGKDEILRELTDCIPMIFILTNSRSLAAPGANSLAFEIGRNIKYASEKSGRNVIVISRGDSTLRGHYPNEVDALGEGLGWADAPQILIPALFQGGRHTIGDIHYVREGDRLIPAGETPFARDSVFGYQSSNLKEYVEEKSGGRIRHQDVVSVSLEQIRLGGPEIVSHCISGLLPGQVCIVNAFSQPDLDVFAAGLYKSIRNGGQFLFRTAASFLNGLAGMSPKELLCSGDLSLNGTGGIVVIGSYVPKTTSQFDFLKNSFDAGYIEIIAGELLTPEGFENEVARVSVLMNNCLRKGNVAVVFTSRKLIEGNNAAENMRIINRVSEGIVGIIRRIENRPRFVIAKGGITSSDILTKAFHVKKAYVTGQIIPGVPVWKLSDCFSFPDLVYLPFPGNLGGDDAIYNAVSKLV